MGSTQNILLAIEAYSPQTITEALYALTQTESPTFLPDAIHLITTIRGRDVVRQALIYDGWLARLCKDYRIPFRTEQLHFHLITDAQGEPLWDVRSAQDNEYAADFISHQVQHFTSDPDTTVRVLLSGGRRSMTYYIGYALSLFGRPQDKLQHVLVEDCYFFLSDFYYPPPQSSWQIDRDGESFDAAQVEVLLADLPWLRLRDGLPQQLLAGKRSFSATLAAAQHQLTPPQVQLDCQHTPPKLYCANQHIPMPPVQLAFYVWMLKRCQAQAPAIHWSDTEPTPLAAQFLQTYQQLYGKTGSYEQVAKALQNGMSKAYFDERKSKLHHALNKILGKASAKTYHLQAHGSRPRTRFALKLPLEAINLDIP